MCYLFYYMGLGKPDQSENEISNVLKRKQCLDFKLDLDIYVVDAGNLGSSSLTGDIRIH